MVASVQGLTTYFPSLCCQDSHFTAVSSGLPSLGKDNVCVPEKCRQCGRFWVCFIGVLGVVQSRDPELFRIARCSRRDGFFGGWSSQVVWGCFQFLVVRNRTGLGHMM